MVIDIRRVLGQAVSSQVSRVTGGLQNAVQAQVSRVAGQLPDVVAGPLRGATGNIGSLVGAAGRQAANQQEAGQGDQQEFRVRLSAVNPSAVYGDGLLAPLSATQGLMFPYTPSVSFSQNVNYTDLSLVHTNGDIQAYQRTPSVSIQIQGKFSVQNQAEAAYAIAVLHFCRTVSKSYFGVQDGQRAGLPPPMLKLNGYGTYMFNELKCIMETHSWNFDESMDMVPFSVAGGTVRLPPLFTLSVNVKVQNTPAEMRTQFSFDKFRTGELMRSGGWI